MRLFFALWPDTALRRALGAWVERLHPACGGRATPMANLHATLAFLGEVAPQAGEALTALLPPSGCGAFELVLDRVGYWRHNRIVYAAPSTQPACLDALAQNLARALRAQGLRCEERPYAAHVTLLRDARDPGVQAIEPLTWRVREIALVESLRAGPRLVYRPLRRWTLAA
jgi:2'-5' RNA ligase